MKARYTVEIDMPNCDLNHWHEVIKWLIEDSVKDGIRRQFYPSSKQGMSVQIIPNTLETNELQSLPKAEDFSPPSEETHKENMQVLGLNT